jgi:hypothetical protein
MRTRIGFVGAILLIGAAVCSAGAGQPISDPTALLKRAVTAGNIALLVEHGLAPGVQARLGEALVDARPEVRAAAARVIFVLGLRSLVPQLTAASANERVADAAFEQLRALAYFGTPDHDHRIVASWQYLPANYTARVAAALAGARGPAAIQHFELLREANPGEAPLADFVRVATRGVAAQLTPVASRAIREKNASLFRAVLQAARDAHAGLTEGIVAAGISAASSIDIRTTAVWHVLQTWDGHSPPSEGLRAVMLETAAAPPYEENPTAAFAFELAARWSGRPPHTEPAWLALIAKPPTELRMYLRDDGIRALLTRAELETLGGALYNDPKALSETSAKPYEDFLTPNPDPKAPALLRAASDYPRGFMASVFDATGCDLSRAQSRGAGAGAGHLALRTDGRVARVMLAKIGETEQCAYAVRV